MNFNLTSRIVTNIFFDDYENALKKIFAAETIAISPISYSSKKSMVINHFLSIKSTKMQFTIAIHFERLNENERPPMEDYLLESCSHTKQILSMIFKSNVTAQCILNKNKVDITQAKKIVFSVHTSIDDFLITLFIPNAFFTLFSNKIKSDTKIETIESAILQFFKNPQWTIPPINIIIQSLSTVELNKLINQLLQQNLLSIYQLYLLTIEYPDLSLKLKQSLSKNRVQDIINFKEEHKDLEITKRDLSGGLYSIQEAIFFMLKQDSKLSYARFLTTMRKLITNIINMEQLLSKSFETWVRDMIQNKLLYKTLSITKDQTIADAIAYEPDKFITIFTKYISEQTIKDIVELVKDKSYTKMISAQITIIQNYKKNKFEKLNPSPESLGFLLTHFSDKEYYNYLLLSVGWFTLSTALKDINPKNIEPLMQNIPQPVRFLIEDVLKGIINPNIIHDEMQISKAKKECVKMIATLGEEGYIELDE